MNKDSLPVEDPILDSAVVIASCVAGGGQWVDDFRLPVGLDESLEVLAISRSWIWDIVVREPALELSLMPLVVCC